MYIVLEKYLNSIGFINLKTLALRITVSNNKFYACTNFHCPVSWGCRIQRGKTPPRLPNECPGYDTKQSDGEVPAVLELWGMQSTPLLTLLPGPL